MFGLSGAELAIIALVIILIFGVGRLSKIGSELGSGLKSFRDALKEEEKDQLEEKKQQVTDSVAKTNKEQQNAHKDA